MAQQTQTPKKDSTPTDAALLAAWRRFLDYDQISSEQKQKYTRLRERVIALSLLTSAGAVVSIYLGQTDTYLASVMPDTSTYAIWLERILSWAVVALRILLIIMPIASVMLLRYASQFASSSSWIEYRVGAETIRSEIYLYRMKAGDYKNLETTRAKSKLLDKIDQANQRIDEQGATVPYMHDYENIEALIATKTETPGKDFGINPIDAENYIAWRVEPQLRWYIGKIRRDYDTLQKEQSRALWVSAAGAVLSGANNDLVGLVAVTTAMGTALTAQSETRMYGATYGIFHWTAEKLQYELNQWKILPDDQKTETQRQLLFVESVEKIFENERELWRSQAMQSQSASDDTINSQLQQTLGQEQFTRYQDAGLIPTGIPTDEVVDEVVDYTRTQSIHSIKIPTGDATSSTQPSDAATDAAEEILPVVDTADSSNGSATEAAQTEPTPIAEATAEATEPDAIAQEAVEASTEATVLQPTDDETTAG